ncbi:cytochrome P450 [Kribbella antibiotica]|uniref:Cytochrome P450 n=1 Tax=Kribbella antibiotica TaxID=190195 RepID=A0A4R4ZRR3_9ACTN|nr:cytochrome P450 [Kribbella antibiotica]TDD61691.1 cytochrome P450 [Kribbella antibiotica]
MADGTVRPVKLADGQRLWLVSGYDNVRRFFTDDRFSRARAIQMGAPSFDNPELMINMDPPDHTRIRRFAAHAFAPRQIERLRQPLMDFATELCAEIADSQPPVDLVPRFANLLPIRAICDLLGIPFADRQRFAHLGDAASVIPGGDTGPVRQAEAQLGEYVGQLVESRRRCPTDDFLSTLITAGDKEDQLSESELISTVISILVAGYQTTIGQFSSFVLELLQRPEQWARLRAEPALFPSAIEELLRYVHSSTAGASLFRVATEDVQLDGGTVPAGGAVIASLKSANLDPARFADPERLDFDRTPNRHLSFGSGSHYCLGAQLARLELQIGIAALVSQFETMRLAVPAQELRYAPNLAMRNLVALPVAW